MSEQQDGPRIATIGVIANSRKPRAAQVLTHLAGMAERLGLQLVADEATAALLPGATAMPVRAMDGRVGAVVALGGDGTMLRLVRELDGAAIAVLGVNIGSLGFMTSIAEEDLERALACLAEGTYNLEPRCIAECTVERAGQPIARYRGLNEIVVSSGPSSRVVTLNLSVDGDSGTACVCDGLIVSTPTGSTGHSLSAGGPITLPDVEAFVISLICPHTLSARPLVVPDRSTIAVTVADSSGELLLSVDGQVGMPLGRGDRIRVCRSAKGVRFIHLPGHNYFAVLRQKLRWSGSTA